VWICKPGENSNRGNGITVMDTRQQLIEAAESLSSLTAKRSLIIQKYIDNPFL
jgi:glutathione synthase/RimK-type ligase-like ATP-grasp enzyme